MKRLAKCVRVWREVWTVWGEVLLQHQLCVIKVSNLRTYNGSHVFTTLRNHLAFLTSTAFHTALQVYYFVIIMITLYFTFCAR